MAATQGSGRFPIIAEALLPLQIPSTTENAVIVRSEGAILDPFFLLIPNASKFVAHPFDEGLLQEAFNKALADILTEFHNSVEWISFKKPMADLPCWTLRWKMQGKEEGALKVSEGDSRPATVRSQLPKQVTYALRKLTQRTLEIRHVR